MRSLEFALIFCFVSNKIEMLCFGLQRNRNVCHFDGNGTQKYSSLDTHLIKM